MHSPAQGKASVFNHSPQPAPPDILGHSLLQKSADLGQFAAARTRIVEQVRELAWIRLDLRDTLLVFGIALQRQELVSRSTRLANGLHGRDGRVGSEVRKSGRRVVRWKPESNSGRSERGVQGRKKAMGRKRGGLNSIGETTGTGQSDEVVGGRSPGGGAHPPQSMKPEVLYVRGYIEKMKR